MKKNTGHQRCIAFGLRYINLKEKYDEIVGKVKNLGPTTTENKEMKKTLMKEQKNIAINLKKIKQQREGTESLFKEYKFIL